MPAPLIIAHRGASAGEPGNSLDAFERAIAVGADMIEFDVRRTRDGELAVIHDPTAGGVPVGRLTREDIGARLGRTPPALEDVLDLAAGRVALDVELKDADCAEDVLAVVGDRLEPEQLLVTSFHAEAIATVKRRAPHVRAGLVLGLSNFGSVAPVLRARRCGADCVLPRRRLAERGLLERAHSAGLKPLVWTINDDQGLRRYLHDPRVHGVITDVPERAIALREAAAARPRRAQPSRGTGASTRPARR